MRTALALAVVASVVPSYVAAEPPVVLSGSFGAGMVGTSPVSIAAAELDLERASFSLGLAAVVRFDGDRLVEGDWDEPRDAARLLRHLLWQPSIGPAALSLAVGRLGGVTAGSGASVDAVTAGVDLDRSRLGAELRLATARSQAHAWVDDLIEPEVAALRVAGNVVGPLEIGATAAGDRAGSQMEAGARGSLGLETALAASSGPVAGRLYTDVVRIAGEGTGAHLGARGQLAGDSGRLGLRVEGHAGTRGYRAGWIGPLYFRDRLAMTAAGGRRTGGLVEIDGGHESVGDVSLRVEHRVGRGPGARLELRVSRLRAVQAGAWAAVTGDAAAFGAELRLRFPRSLFSRLELQRLYSTAGAAPVPLWGLALTFGASYGD